MVTGIIGGGASGMAAALAAARNPGVQVVLMERQSRVGRKLLATGNGRCNLSNLRAGHLGYHGEEPDFWKFALTQYPPQKTLAAFRKLGLYTVAEPSGRVYPYSDQANSVVDVLRFALEKPNITVKLGFEAAKVKRSDGGFRVESREETIQCDSLIVACGGLAGTKLGGSMAGYQILRSLGHSCTKLRPTLVQLKADWAYSAALKGVRANCDVQILHNGELFAESRGEIQFTQYGLSGPVIFEVSRDVCREPGQWICRLDLLPNLYEEDIVHLLSCHAGQTAGELFTGILHNRLGRTVAQCAGIRLNDQVEDLESWQLLQAARLAKCLEISLTEPMGMDSAQVTAGGIRTTEFNSETMESRKVPGLYACGEVLDVDGDCGGYNLQWAWSSGFLAGENAGRRIK